MKEGVKRVYIIAYSLVSILCVDLLFLAHRIRISEMLPWDRKSYLTHAILPRTSS